MPTTAKSEPEGPQATSVDPEEVARFAALAERWWDPEGSFRPLHQLNPVRVAYIRDALAAAHGRDAHGPAPLSGLSVLDVGCGGGLIAEPLTRLGAEVTAIDAAEKNIAVARLHAEQSGLDIDYRHESAEALAASGATYDSVLALEVVEHVADLPGFLATGASLLKPGGTIILATLNRTLPAYLLGIVAAERVLGWLPRGTHQWSKFVRPSELARMLRRHGVAIQDISGVAYNPLAGVWTLSRNVSVNYMVRGVRGESTSG